MKYIVEFIDDIEQETIEFHAVSNDVLRERVKEWMEEDGHFLEASAYSDAGRFLFNIYL